jgi:superoxide dismutase
MERITNKHLEGMIARLNRLTNSPAKPYERNEAGRLVAQIGNYHLSQAYGGVCLHRMHNEGGGVTTPLSGGHVPKRELYEQIYAFIRGIETAQGG